MAGTVASMPDMPALIWSPAAACFTADLYVLLRRVRQGRIRRSEQDTERSHATAVDAASKEPDPLLEVIADVQQNSILASQTRFFLSCSHRDKAVAFRNTAT